MKRVALTLLSTVALFSTASFASYDTYVFSNTEYCQLAIAKTTKAHLDAYADKLGYQPSEQECRTLTAQQGTAVASAGEQDVKTMLKAALKGSVVRPTTSMIKKIEALPQHERQQVIAELFQ